MNTIEAAALLGIPESEVNDVFDSPAGDVIVTKDGCSYVYVTGGDAEGKTGVMFLAKPWPDYVGPFPVYAGPVDAATADEVAEDRAKPRRARGKKNDPAPADPLTVDVDGELAARAAAESTAPVFDTPVDSAAPADPAPAGDGPVS